jgi:hypothetical protein
VTLLECAKLNAGYEVQISFQCNAWVAGTESFHRFPARFICTYIFNFNLSKEIAFFSMVNEL